MNWMMIQYSPAATRAVAGMVRNQAVAISWATPQRTLLTLSAAPTPMMAELTTWVVLTGPPSKGGAQDNDRRGQLGGKTIHRADLVKLTPQGVDQLPATHSRAQGDHPGADKDDPEWNSKYIQVPTRDQGQSDDAHGFLGVVGSVAERQRQARSGSGCV